MLLVGTLGKIDTRNGFIETKAGPYQGFFVRGGKFSFQEQLFFFFSLVFLIFLKFS